MRVEEMQEEVKELRRKQSVLKQQLSLESEQNQKLLQQVVEHEEHIEALKEYNEKRMQDEFDELSEQLREITARFEAMQQDHDDIQQRFREQQQKDSDGMRVLQHQLQEEREARDTQQ